MKNSDTLRSLGGDNVNLTRRNAFKYSAIAFVVFAILQITMGLDNAYSVDSICLKTPQSYLLQQANLISAACFFTKGLLILFTCCTSQRVLAGTPLDISGVCCCFTIVFMAGISSLLTATTNWGGTCEDAFGLQSPGTRMGEWTACVPLILYYVLSMEAKNQLSGMDFKILGSITIAMICFDLLQIVNSFGLSIFFLLSSHCFCIIAFTIMLASSRGWMTSRSHSMKIFVDNNTINFTDNDYKNDEKDKGNNQSSNSGSSNELRVFTRRRLEGTLCLTFPVFVIIYYLGLSKLFHSDIIELLFIAANFCCKLVFVSIAIDSYGCTVYQGYLEQIYANEARQAYLRFVMHEVRVPLSSISMGIDALQMIEEEKGDPRIAVMRSRSRLLLDMQADKESNETLSMMRDATAFMGNTLNSVLNIQKIEEGKLQLTMAPFILKDLIHRVHQILKGNLHKKNISLKIHIDHQIPKRLIADSFQIEHVLANFLSNAIKFSSEGSLIEIIVTLCDSVKRIESIRSIFSFGSSLCRMSSFSFHRIENPTKITQDSVWVRFAVRDHGIGISPENVAKLFRPFMQIRPGELQGGGGSGVGLSICKQIVELHNGSLGCDSVVNEGSTFYFKLPLLIADTLSMEEQSVFSVRGKPENGHTESPPNDLRRTSSIYLNPEETHNLGVPDFERSPSLIPCQDKRNVDTSEKDILVVDDASINRKLLLKLLSRRLVVCSEAVDGAMAVEMVKDDLERYQIIFMDNLMPNLNGLEATTLIRRLGYSGIIIGLTGNAMQDDVERFIASGADAVYAKPINLDTLNRVFQFVDDHK